MSKKRDTVYMHGTLYWAKIFGAPRTNYNEDGREWAFEFEPDEDGVADLRERGLYDRMKTKFKKDGSIRRGYEDREPYLVLKRKELDYEGKPNEHIRVVDAANQPWNDKTLIGNKTEADVKIQIVDYGAGKKAGIYPIAIRVLELVPFVSNDFEPLASDDPRAQSAKEKYNANDFEKDFGLNEDEPTSEPTEEEAPSADTDDDPPVD